MQFIRNTCLRTWMDERGIGDNDLHVYCSQQALDFPCAALLNEEARQTSADRAWHTTSPLLQKLPREETGQEGLPPFSA